MSLIPRCVRCDGKLDPYGRDGGITLCEDCRKGKIMDHFIPHLSLDDIDLIARQAVGDIWKTRGPEHAACVKYLEQGSYGDDDEMKIARRAIQLHQRWIRIAGAAHDPATPPGGDNIPAQV